VGDRRFRPRGAGRPGLIGGPGDGRALLDRAGLVVVALDEVTHALVATGRPSPVAGDVRSGLATEDPRIRFQVSHRPLGAWIPTNDLPEPGRMPAGDDE